MQIDKSEAEHFIRELIWREFSYSLLYYFPTITNQNFKTNFTEFPWRRDEKALKLWQKGKTGYPIVDAGMRELLGTGYMHNRVRMIVASFLTKNLMLHWIQGARWFWDCLLDADLASNSCSWQWVAGTGADAAPYFRIFNPVTQSQKFDSDGTYIKKFLPELASVPNKYIHDPSNAPEVELLRAGVTLGVQYPHAIVDLKETRTRALEAYKAMNGT
jgi:deoxyribodipyrimidine photo-lyase